MNRKVLTIAKKAKSASFDMAAVSRDLKDKALLLMADALITGCQLILAENRKDLAKAQKNNLSGAFVDRLALSEERIKKMSDSLRSLVALKDPVGEVIKEWSSPSGLLIKKVRVPIGVIAIIYESRPDVTSDCMALTIKSGNCVILRGGSEAINSNKAIFKVLLKAIEGLPIPSGAINLIDTTDRQTVKDLLTLSGYIDLVIPRGGQGLIRQVARISRIPVIKHYKGICHIYVDEDADLNMAQKVCFNAKVQRPGTCNAMETMLVHKDVAARFLSAMIKQFQQAGVEIRGCPLTAKIVKEKIKKVTQKDFRTEYLDLILSVRVVDSVKDAINHINTYGSGHSDSIITDNVKNAEYFLNRIDSACVYHNASTRFTDGHQFGMGAEIGISTDKIHARGPMALEELTIYKYMVYGNGQLRE